MWILILNKECAEPIRKGNVMQLCMNVKQESHATIMQENIEVPEYLKKILSIYT